METIIDSKYLIAVAGTGYVGLSIATLLSQHHKVFAVDIIPEKVEPINHRKSPIRDEYIEKYLAEKESNKKPKILLVDDSITIRQRIRSLLSEHYEVSEVGSGAAAIRAITLDRPDLVLLDYEMPVCDGSHVLAMLRSEKEFADVPVIFLTSKDDPDSVKKVLSLRADGYLLKYLNPIDIKKRIDEYFKKKTGC